MKVKEKEEEEEGPEAEQDQDKEQSQDQEKNVEKMDEEKPDLTQEKRVEAPVIAQNQVNEEVQKPVVAPELEKAPERIQVEEKPDLTVANVVEPVAEKKTEAEKAQDDEKEDNIELDEEKGEEEKEVQEGEEEQEEGEEDDGEHIDIETEHISTSKFSDYYQFLTK